MACCRHSPAAATPARKLLFGYISVKVILQRISYKINDTFTDFYTIIRFQ